MVRTAVRIGVWNTPSRPRFEWRPQTRWISKEIEISPSRPSHQFCTYTAVSRGSSIKKRSSRSFFQLFRIRSTIYSYTCPCFSRGWQSLTCSLQDGTIHYTICWVIAILERNMHFPKIENKSHSRAFIERMNHKLWSNHCILHAIRI
jgi:hypothetical protein